MQAVDVSFSKCNAWTVHVRVSNDIPIDDQHHTPSCFKLDQHEL